MAAKKLSSWGKNMIVKIQTKKMVGWEERKRNKIYNRSARKIQRSWKS